MRRSFGTGPLPARQSAAPRPLLRGVCGTLPRALALLSAVAMAGCGAIGGGSRPATPEVVTEFQGGVVADEPSATLAGREVLATNGTAVDAAVAMAFVQAVTLPATAGLGSGGVCLLYDPARKRLETIDFSLRPASRSLLGVPALVRGMALLHARGGTQRWEQLLAPAERLARLGAPVSRAMLANLSADTGLTPVRPPLRPLFAGAQLGGTLVQPDLAVTLGRLRASGAGDFYTGVFARQLVDGIAALQGDLTAEDLRTFVPSLREPLLVPFGTSQVVLPPPPAGAGGAIAAQYLAGLTQANWAGARQEDRVHVAVEVLKRTIAAESSRADGEPILSPARAQALVAGLDRTKAQPVEGASLPAAAEAPSSGLVAVDSSGMAVACAMTLGSRFGTGVQVPGTGLFMAAAPRVIPVSTLPAMVVNTRSSQTFAALSSFHDRSAPQNAILTILGTLVEERTLEVVLSRPRLHAGAGPVQLEPEAVDSAGVLEDRGHPLERVQELGRVHAIICPTGLPQRQPVCDLRADPRSGGLAAGGQ
ncbi:MAG: gamma-glutamyltransferase [Alphaproteobacteria bacterium]|nr:gamma-glutamyltransferase [Alphaproteobacteria bacterium]